jgi:hypothetical protein
MEVCRCVEFIGVELTTGAELAAPMRRPWRARGVVEREEDGLLLLAWWRRWLAERRGNGEGGVVESAVTEVVRTCGGASCGGFF